MRETPTSGFSRLRFTGPGIAAVMVVVTGVFAAQTAATGVTRAAAVPAPSIAATPAATSSPCLNKASRHLKPAAGFNPLTASAAALDAHNFPPRPSNPKMLRDWRGYARKYLAGQVW